MVPDQMPEKLSCSRVRFDVPAAQEVENPASRKNLQLGEK
jgi:hypothetical protein